MDLRKMTRYDLESALLTGGYSGTNMRPKEARYVKQTASGAFMYECVWHDDASYEDGAEVHGHLFVTYDDGRISADW